jgi:NAD(P)H-hydrate epimerase
VLDADALALLAAGTAPLAGVRENDILTPHPGEAGMFLRTSASEVRADGFAALRALCALHPGIWVLKGSGALLGRRGQAVIIAPGHAPCLSVGGSGDVLAGCMGSLSAQGCAPLPAAALGVLLHARAGKILEESFPERGNSAREIADALPRARALLRNALPDFMRGSRAGESA